MAEQSASTYVPLTTTFTPASECTQSYFSGCYPAISGTLVCQAAIYPTETCQQTNLNCYPLLPTEPLRAYSYSPGFICPVGWTMALQDVQTPDETNSTTTVHCCPTGLSVTSALQTTWCQTIKFSGVADVLIDGCTSSTEITYARTSTAIMSLSYYNYDLSESTTQTGPIYWSITAFGLEMIWQASDEELRSSFLAFMTADTSSTASNTTQTSLRTRPTGLSTGAKAGIGCGVGIGASVALLGILYFFCRRRKRQQQEPVAEPVVAQDNSDDNDVGQRASELYGSQQQVSQSPWPISWRDSHSTAVTSGSPPVQGQWACVPASHLSISNQSGISGLQEVPDQLGHDGSPSELMDESSDAMGHGRNVWELSGDSTAASPPTQSS
ncbi:hypothetical protein VM1G_11571 [Cytospora mali]|uniref:Uncharacterized protein n=1 Tax=Cytospora mali TaxID=578113 RepID=A0A194VVY4_CYTMA|nr:hypothetical protein VM1G_11571 [Valsa mali]